MTHLHVSCMRGGLNLLDDVNDLPLPLVMTRSLPMLFDIGGTMRSLLTCCRQVYLGAVGLSGVQCNV